MACSLIAAGDEWGSTMVQGVGFVGLRTERVAETVALFRDITGAPLGRIEGHLAGFALADGEIFEI